ncbi:MAG: hypothetical protein WKF34_10065 [Pyrinomonadaceae bacterium]
MKKNILGVTSLTVLAIALTLSVNLNHQVVQAEDGSGSTVYVTENNQQGWSYAATNAGGDVNFVTDPSAPGGSGALQLTTDGTNAARAQYLHAANTRLRDVDELSYYTRQISGPAHAAAAYQLITCLGGRSTTGQCIGFTTFNFEPYQNGVVATNGTWQFWDVDAGQFWSTRTVNAGGACTVTAGNGGAPFYRLQQLQTACPSAVVVGFGANVGTFNPNYNVYVDQFNFDGTTYNFQPYMVALTKEACKNGGFELVTQADGQPFRNQGQCVSYVNRTQNDDDDDDGDDDDDATPSPSPSPSPSISPSPSPTVSPSPTASPTPSPTRTPSPSPTRTPSATPTPSPTATATPGTSPTPMIGPPTNAAQCKNGGWQRFNTPRTFRNQGDCIQFVRDSED